MDELTERRALETAAADAKVTATYYQELLRAGVAERAAFLATQAWISAKVMASTAAMLVQRCPRCGGPIA